jgi:hypothetical protein
MHADGTPITADGLIHGSARSVDIPKVSSAAIGVPSAHIGVSHSSPRSALIEIWTTPRI